MYYVYILQSEKTSRYYCGSCQDLQKRLKRHNMGLVPSTRHGTLWKLIHFETFSTRSEACRKELKIKKRGIGRYLNDLNSTGP